MRRLTILCITVLLNGACGVISVQAVAEDEKTITIQDVPAAVREAIARLFPNTTIQELEMEMRDGKPVYEIEVRTKGTTTIVKVDEQGKMLKTRIKKATTSDDDAGH